MSRARDFADLASAYSQDAIGQRNILINGNMSIYQRGSSVITGNAGAYALDRWQFYQYGGGHATITQDTEVPTGQGFLNSLRVDVTQAESSMAASDLYILRQRVEGFNCQRIRKGTSSARPLTLQFWVRSPKTGIHTVQIWDETDATRHVSKSYTISTADTWQYVTVTFPADTSGGAFSDDNQPALQLQFWLGGGSTYTGGSSLGETWGSTANERAVGQVNCMDNTSNNFYITGIQLECGEVATPFEHESYDETLRKCLRYYIMHKNTSGDTTYFSHLQAYSTTNIFGHIKDYPATMRTTPSVAQSGTYTGAQADSSNASMATAIGNLVAGADGWGSQGWGSGSGLTAGHYVNVAWQNNAYLTADAEL